VVAWRRPRPRGVGRPRRIEQRLFLLLPQKQRQQRRQTFSPHSSLASWPLVRRNAEYVPHDLIQFSFGTLIHLRGCLARLSSAQYVYLVAATSRVPLERASSISQSQCPIRVELTRSGLASGTVGPAATLAFTLSPLSGAYRPFIRPISKGSSGSN
jgi:hypothetical protein